MMSLIEEIHPLQRMINSRGLDDAFAITKRYLPALKVHEYEVGSQADDWEVPFAWNLRSAYLKDMNGNVIASHKDSHLFVAAYSEPVDGVFSKDEIRNHIRCHPEEPDAFFMEHRNAYNYQLIDWNITLPQNVWDALPNEDYQVKIEIEKEYDRTMKVGEVFIPGERDQTICFTAHIDELCNDNLSSCAVLTEFFKQLIDEKAQPKYSYQLLLIPEVIGAFFYIHNNMDRTEKTVSMINLETVGRGKRWIVKKSLKEDKYIDRLMQVVSAEILQDYDTVSMFDGYGNEERVYEYPKIAVPSVALQRFPFSEYHSSNDTPDRISEEHLQNALKFVSRLYELIELDYLPSYKMVLPPWLTKHGMYFDSKDQPELFQKFMNELQFSIDGKSSLVDLCSKLDLPFDMTYGYLEQYFEKGFLIKSDTHEIW